METKIPIGKMIEALNRAGVYDSYSGRKLELLFASFQDATDIGQKERAVVRKVFADHTDQIDRQKTIQFLPLFDSGKITPGREVTCEVLEFLGYGNMGPVYAVKIDNQSYALKVYSAREIRESQKLHGTFGLGGLLQNVQDPNAQTTLTELGATILAKKPKGAYGRAKRIVKIHNVGTRGDYLYVLMDMLAVSPINQVDPGSLGGDLLDLVNWAVDCAVGLAHLHAEERRLHLNIRPEAFIRRDLGKGDKRLPRYTFFHYPKEYPKHEGCPSMMTEFILVDHLDTSIDIADKTPKGLASFGSWPYMPPEAILGLIKILREDYNNFVVNGRPVEKSRTIAIKRSQVDDIWALGLTFFEFLSGGKSLLGEPKNLGEMVNSILLTKFDFSLVDERFRELLSAMLEKDRQKRYARCLYGCPSKVRQSELAIDAVLFKLEEIALQIS